MQELQAHKPLTREQVCSLLNVSPRKLKDHLSNGTIRQVETYGKQFYFLDLDHVNKTKQTPTAVKQAATEVLPAVDVADNVYLLPRGQQFEHPQQVGLVPLDVHQIALDHLADLTSALTRMVKEAVVTRERIDAFTLRNQRLRQAVQQQRGQLQKLELKGRAIENLLAQAHEHKELRKSLRDELASTPRWRWRKRRALRKQLLEL